MLYRFLKRGCVAKNYERHASSRLLEQHWNRHLRVTDLIYNNYRGIVKVLNLIAASREYSRDDVQKLSVYLLLLTNASFDFA